MTKSEAIQKARKLAKKHKDNFYVIQDEPGLGCGVLSQDDYDDYPDQWRSDEDVVAIFDEFGRCA